MQMQLTGFVVVPEPDSMVLGLIGAGGLWLTRRTNNRSQTSPRSTPLQAVHRQ
jgi:hypothetical protein